MSLHEISNNSTLWVVGAFLLITLAVGLYAGRGIKTIKEYALGDGRFSSFTLVLTFLATIIGGGSVIGASGLAYSTGILVFIASVGMSIGYLIFALLIAPKIKYFIGCLTIGDIMHNLYGKNARYLTGLLTFIYCVFTISMQIYILGNICKSLLNINAEYCIVLGGLILGLYSALGGIKSVTITDVFQFLVLIIAIPVIASLSLKHAGGFKELFFKLPSDRFSVFDHKQFYKYLSYFLMWSIFPTMLTNPAIMQRTLMINNTSQAKNNFYVISVFYPVFISLIVIIGLSGFMIYPNLNSKVIFPYIVNNLLPISLKGLAVSGILAVIMSTADSYLHSAGLVFSHDLLNPLFGRKKTRFNELLTARIFTVLVGVISVIIALKIKSFNSFRIIAIETTAPVILFPLFAGIIGLKTTRTSFIFGIIIGTISLILSHVYLPKKIVMLSMPLSVFMNGIAFMFIHILQNKGLVFVKREKESSKTTEKPWQPSIKKAFNWLYGFIPTPKKIFYFSRESVIKHGTFNIIFGIYCCVNFTLPYFMWDHEVKETYDFMIYLRLIGGVMAGLCIVKDEWKEFIKPYFPLFWHITLLFCLPFVTTLMFLLTHGSFTWLFNIATSIFFLILLVDGAMFCILGPLGVALGVGYYKWQFGPLNMSSLGFDTNYYLIYQILFPTIISLLFAYRKKFFYLIRGNQGVNLGLSLCHELRNTGLQALPSSQYLNRKALQMQAQTENKRKGVYELDEKMMKFIISRSSEVEQHTKETIKVVSTFEKLLLEFRNSLSNPQICSIKSVVEYTLDEYSFLPGQKKRVITRLHEDFYSKIPKEAFSFVLSNIIRNSYKHGRATEINLWLETQELHIRDNGQGIPASEITEIFKLFYTTGDQTSRGVGLAFAKQIVESFYGEIWCESEEGKNSYTEFIIKFPEVCVGEITDRSLHIAEKEGLLKGKNDSKKQIAIRMIIEGESVETIEKFTELSVSEIQELIRDYKKEKTK